MDRYKKTYMTQKEKVIAQFNEFGYVSRNWALKKTYGDRKN